MNKFCVKPLSTKAIRQLVQALRKESKLNNVIYFPIVQFIEWLLCDPDNGVDYEIVPIDEMNDTYGITNTSDNVLRIREDVYKGAVFGNPRDRFTLCHEVGHFFLHQPDRVEFARGTIPAFRDPEWQANMFAAELMAPYELANGLSVKEISEKFGMSLQAAQIRYNQCNSRC